MRTMIHRSSALLTALLLAGLSAVDAPSAAAQAQDVSKVGTTAGTFLEIPVGPVAIGLGGAFVSLSGDATALYWNAAGIASMTQNDLVVSHTNWIASTKHDFAGYVLPLGGSAGALGFSFTSLSMADMKVRTVEFPEGTGEFFSAGDLAAGVSYARTLSDRFAIGATVKYIQETIWHESASAFALDIGSTFRTDLFGGMVIGASLLNFGTSMQLSGRDARQFIRIDPTKLGSTDQIPTDIEFDSWDLPLLFQFGVSTNVVKTDEYRVTVAVDALHPSDDYESVNVGGEFSFEDYVFIRGGYQSLFLPDAEGGASVGFGVSTGQMFTTGTVRFDYAYRDMGRLEGVHVFGLQVQF